MDEMMMPSVNGPTHHPTTPHQVSLPRLAAGRVERGGGRGVKDQHNQAG